MGLSFFTLFRVFSFCLGWAFIAWLVFPCLVSFCLFVCYCMLSFMGWRNTAGCGLLSVATELEYKLVDLI